MEITVFTAAAGLAFGVVGTALGIWNRVDKIREDRAKRRSALPSLMATVREVRPDGWGKISILIEPRMARRFDVLRISSNDEAVLFAPSKEQQRRRVRSAIYASRSVWDAPYPVSTEYSRPVAAPREEPEPDIEAASPDITFSPSSGLHVSQKSVALHRWIKLSASLSSGTRDCEIFARCKFASDSREEFTIHTTARINTPAA